MPRASGEGLQAPPASRCTATPKLRTQVLLSTKLIKEIAKFPLRFSEVARSTSWRLAIVPRCAPTHGSAHARARRDLVCRFSLRKTAPQVNHQCRGHLVSGQASPSWIFESPRGLSAVKRNSVSIRQILRIRSAIIYASHLPNLQTFLRLLAYAEAQSNDIASSAPHGWIGFRYILSKGCCHWQTRCVRTLGR
jgi:hypothetical protein